MTVIKDFVKVMVAAEIFEQHRFLAETLYKFKNGSFIKFIGLDKEDVGKGLRCHIAYFNEINKCKKEAYIQIASRAELVLMDWNPDAEFFVDDFVLPDPDCDFLQLTFEDNELLSPIERAEILKYKERGYYPDGKIKDPYWANRWQVYGLGNIGNLQGVVFNNWSIIDEIPKDAKLVSHGMDFGFTNDPTAFGSMFRLGDDLYLDELFYRTGLLNSDIINLLNGIIGEIVADSAEPKSIEEIRRAGFEIRPARKGTDSIKMSIDLLQRFNLKVTRRSVNLQKELRAYRWKVDVNGKSMNEPVDEMNHAIDGIMRYPALNHLRTKSESRIY